MSIRSMFEVKLRKELLPKKDLDLDEARGICIQYESAMAESKISRGKVEISEVDRLEEEEQQGELDRLEWARS